MKSVLSQKLPTTECNVPDVSSNTQHMTSPARVTPDKRTITQPIRPSNHVRSLFIRIGHRTRRPTNTNTVLALYDSTLTRSDRKLSTLTNPFIVGIPSYTSHFAHWTGPDHIYVKIIPRHPPNKYSSIFQPEAKSSWHV